MMGEDRKEPIVTTATLKGAPAPTLTAQDRCDSCGAQAYFEVTIPYGDGKAGVLLFCVHHFREGEKKLRSIAISITDESAHLEVVL